MSSIVEICVNKMNYTELQNYLSKRLNRRVSFAEIARWIDLDRSSISVYVKNNAELKQTHKLKLENELGIEINDKIYENYFVCDDKFIDAKYFTDVIGSCGSGIFEQSQNFELVKIPKYLVDIPNTKKDYSIITAKGNSMSGAIEDGDKLLVESFDNEQIIDNQIYVFCYKQELFIKRLCKNINQIIIKSDNEDFPTRYIENDDINNIYIIGKVVALVRNYS